MSTIWVRSCASKLQLNMYYTITFGLCQILSYNSFLMYNLSSAAIHLFMIQSFIYFCVGWPGYEQLSRPQSITSRQINNNYSLSGMQEHNQLSQKKLVEMSITAAAAALKSLAKQQQQRWTTKPKLHPLL